MSNHTTNEIPYGYCHCGCGQKTTIPRQTDLARNRVKGQPIAYKVGHQKHPIKPALEFCACGCGQPIKKAKHPSAQKRFISGHNNRQPVAPRFWERVSRLGPDDCWNWKAGTGSHGYGALSIDGTPNLAHRIAWELANGPIPDNLHVLHRCDNRLCCNVNHLFLGTNLENIQDMVKKGRQARGEDKPDQKGEANVTAVLTAKEVMEIRERCAKKEKQANIAEHFGVSKGHISHIFNRDVWKHI